MKKNVVKAMSLGLSAVTLAGSINMTALADEITSEEQIENTTENVSENPTETNTEDASDEASKSLSDAVESVGEYNKSVNEDNMGVVEGDLTASEAASEAAKEAAEAGKNASVSEAVKQAEKAADAVATAEAVKVQAEEKVENAQDACNEAKTSLDNARAELNKLLAKNGINVDHKEDYSEDMQAAIDSAQKVLNDAQLAYDSAVSELSDAEARLNSAELNLAAKEKACKDAEEALANSKALKAGAEYAKGVYTTNYEAATKFLREAQAKQIDNANKLNKLNGEYTDAVEANEKIDFNENDLSQAEIDLGIAEKDFESAESLNNYINQIDESINNLSTVRSKDNNTKIAEKLIEYYVYQSLDNKSDYNPALLKMKSNFSSPEWERHYIEVWYNNQFQGYFNFETLDKNGNHVSGVNFFGLGSVYERDTHQISIIKKSSAWSYGGDVVLYEKSGSINGVEKSYTSEKVAAKNALSDAKNKKSNLQTTVATLAQAKSDKEAAEQKVQDTKKAYDDAVKQYGVDSEEAKKLAVQIIFSSSEAQRLKTLIAFSDSAIAMANENIKNADTAITNAKEAKKAADEELTAAKSNKNDKYSAKNSSSSALEAVKEACKKVTDMAKDLIGLKDKKDSADKSLSSMKDDLKKIIENLEATKESAEIAGKNVEAAKRRAAEAAAKNNHSSSHSSSVVTVIDDNAEEMETIENFTVITPVKTAAKASRTNKVAKTASVSNDIVTIEDEATPLAGDTVEKTSNESTRVVNIGDEETPKAVATKKGFTKTLAGLLVLLIAILVGGTTAYVKKKSSDK